MSIDDTIAAIATPVGEGGVGIIRVSGDDAVRVAARAFAPNSGGPADGMASHSMHYGYVMDPLTGERIDDGLITLFRAPRSYTGEDCVEISCHGGFVATRRVLESVLRAGARLAEPGEFTRRAFMNGRIDLAQAEAVLDVIRAQTDDAMRVARRQLDGVLSSTIRALRDELIGMLAYIEASIDFSEDVGEADPEHVRTSVDAIMCRTSDLLRTADRGRIYREGIRVAIVARPNVGKSSLLNALLRESRAIVTPIPGTTRDTIEESVSIRGIPVRAIDTAGVRETEDVVERLGVDRAKRVAEDADMVLVVLDALGDVTAEARMLLDELPGRRHILVLNKADLVSAADLDCMESDVVGMLASRSIDAPVMRTAASSGIGIAELEDAIADTILTGGLSSSGEALISNVRHRRALEEAMGAMEQAVATAESGLPIDLVSIDLKSAIESLGSITGETVVADVIDRIFSEFCIGK